MNRRGSNLTRGPRALVGMLLLGATTAASEAGAPSFSNQTASAGISAVQTPIGLHPDLAGGAVGDFNGDGFQDIYFAGGGGTPDQLLINNGNGTFTDRAAEWGIALAHRSSGAAVADYDGDGDLDLYVTSLGTPDDSLPGNHKLYRNAANAGFEEVAADADVNWTSTTFGDGWGAAFGDYDLDGDLDLAVAGKLTANGNQLFRNNGDGTFTDVNAAAGLTNIETNYGFAPRFVDLDGDRWPELIWIGDFGTSEYYVNNADGTFTLYTDESGTGHDTTEMGATVADFNHDGLFDFYVTTIETNNLYINQGDHSFVNTAETVGVEDTAWGWATAAVDLDHDMRIDIVATSQDAGQFAFRCTTVSPLSFTSVGAAIGFSSSVSGRGLSTFDYDNDGDQDVVLFPRSGPVTLLRNDLSGTDINWIRVFLEPGDATDIPPHGIGSVVSVTIGGDTRIGRIDGGSNYLSQCELTAHFGLGAATMVDELRVEWSNGATTTLTNVAANQTLTIAFSAQAEDVNGDGSVNVDDLVAVILAWGPCPGCAADIDGSGAVDVDDLIAVILAWG